MPDPGSPLQQAFARFWRPQSVRLAVWVLGAVMLIGIYAPFISSETAIVWWDDHGLGFPIVIDLFNQLSYSKSYDLLFNVAALLLPFFMVFYWLCRRRSIRWRLVWCITLLLSCWLLAMLPLLPSGRAVWNNRKVDDRNIITYQHQSQSGHKIFAIFPLIPHRRDAMYQDAGLLAPGSVNPAVKTHFWLGSDTDGRDVASLIVFGSRISLTIGFISTGISLIIGVLIGGFSAYCGGWIDLLLQRLVEIMLCFPTFILILSIVAIVGHDIFYIMLVIGLTGWAGIARLVRGEFLNQTQNDYVLAARAIGSPRMRIIFRHILPNTMAPLIITATFGIAGAVQSESALSFLGMGDPTAASWGLVMEEGRENISYAWMIYASGVSIFVLVTVLNIIGNGLRDAFDPKST